MDVLLLRIWGRIILNVTFYKNYSDNKAVNKILETVEILSAEWLDNTSVLSPVFIVSGGDNILSCNYVYCDRTQRYYFVKDIQVDAGGQKIIICDGVDTLQTYKNYLLSQNFHIIRDSEKPTFTKDAKLPMKPYKKVDTIKFEESEFNLNTADEYSYNYVLVCAGGGSGQSETE